MTELADTDSDDMETVEDQESSVVQTLRAKLKEAEKRLKDAEGQRDSALDEARAQVARESQAYQVVSDLGYPKLAPVVLDRLDGEITAEAVATLLAELGLEAEGSGESNDESAESSAERVEKVANLGQQVADAARGQKGGTLEQKLDKARSPAEVAQIMADAGLAQSQ